MARSNPKGSKGMSLRQTLVGGAIAGAVVPAVCWILSYVFEIGFNRWTTFIWPSSIFLLAADGHERTRFGLLVLTIAVIGNVVLYMFVGAIICFAIRLLQRGNAIS